MKLMTIIFCITGMVVGGGILSRFVSDLWILQISLWNNVVLCLIIGLAQSMTMIFIGKFLKIIIVNVIVIMNSRNVSKVMVIMKTTQL